MLHETFHGLGFGSRILANGQSPSNTYSYYDTFLKNNSNQPLITWDSCYSVSTQNMGPSGNPLAYLTTPCSLKFAGTANTFIYSSSPFVPGTSLSHYPIGACGNLGTYLMNSSLNPAQIKRIPDSAEVRTLCDLGYITTGTFTNFDGQSGAGYLHNYYPSCGTQHVAGVNDHATYTASAPGNVFSALPNTGGAYTPYTIHGSDILDNDANADRYDCVSILSGSSVSGITLGGTLSDGNAGTDITIIPPQKFSGTITLQYKPYNSTTGQRGNTTYIFIDVPLPVCDTPFCNLICNGDFEFITNLGVRPLSSFGISDMNNSPDLYPNIPPYGTFGDPAILGANCGTNLVPSPNGTGNTKFIAMGTYPSNREAIFFALNSPLISSHMYEISFWISASCDVTTNFLFSQQRPCENNIISITPTFTTICSDSTPYNYIPDQVVSSIDCNCPGTNPQWTQKTVQFIATHNDGFVVIYNDEPDVKYPFFDDFSIVEVPIITMSPSVTICPGASTTLSASGASTYSWSPATGLSATTGASVTASPTSTTTYTVTGTNTCGMTGDAVTVTVTVLPTLLTVSPSVTICPGTSTVLTASGTSTYSWSPATGLSATTGATVTASLTVTTTYSVTGTDVNGCVETKTVTVTVFPTPTVTVSPSVTICPGTSTILSASGASTYYWSPATGLSATTGTTVTASPTVTTTYFVTGTDGNGCEAVAKTITVTMPTLIMTVSPDVIICPGASAILSASGETSYRWSPGTGLSATTGSNVTASPTSTITYTVVGTNNCGMPGETKTITVTVVIPTLTISDDTTYNNVIPWSTNVYSNVTIGIAPTTTITATTDQDFKFTTLTTVNGPFSSGTTGKTLSIVPTPCNP